MKSSAGPGDRQGLGDRMGKRKAVPVLLFLVANRLLLADLAPAPAAWSMPSAVPAGQPTHLVLSSLSEGLSIVASTGEDHAAGQTSGLGESPAVPCTGLPMLATSGACPPKGESAPARALELPPPPSGSTLTLSGLLTLGVMQLTRSASQVRTPQLLRAVQLGHGCVGAGADLGPFAFQELPRLAGCWPSLVALEPFRPERTFHSPNFEDPFRSSLIVLLAVAPRSPPQM